MDMNPGRSDKQEVQQDFNADAGNHGIHGDFLFAEALQNTAGRLDDGEEHHRHGGEGQQFGRQADLFRSEFPYVAIEE